MSKQRHKCRCFRAVSSSAASWARLKYGRTSIQLQSTANAQRVLTANHRRPPVIENLQPNNPYAAPLESEEQPEAGPRVNPWLAIWTSPRATIRYVLQSSYRSMTLPLAAMLGISSTLRTGARRAAAGELFIPLGFELVIAAATVLVVGALIGVAIAYVLGFCYTMASRLLGGHATNSEVRAAYAWGYSPSMYTAPFAAAAVCLASVDPDLFLGPVRFSLQTAIAGLGIWSLVTLTKCVAEVNKFSAWRGLGVVSLGTLLLVIPIFAIPMLLTVIF